MTNPEPDHSLTLMLLACRPADPNDYPEGPARDNLATLAPLDPGWIDLPCQACGMTVRMGPRQRSQYDLDPKTFQVLDFLCAVKLAKNGGLPVDVHSLGGK